MLSSLHVTLAGLMLLFRIVSSLPAPQMMEPSTWTRARMSTEGGITTTVFVTGVTTVNLQTASSSVKTSSTSEPTFQANSGGGIVDNTAVNSIALAPSSTGGAAPIATVAGPQEATSNSSVGPSRPMATVMIAIASVIIAGILLIGLVYTLLRLRKHRETERELRGAVYGVNNLNIKNPKMSIVDRVKQSLGRQVSMTRRASFRAYVPPDTSLNQKPTTSTRIIESIEPFPLPREAWSSTNVATSSTFAPHHHRDPASLKSEIHIYPEDRPPFFKRHLISIASIFKSSNGNSSASSAGFTFNTRRDFQDDCDEPKVILMKHPSKPRSEREQQGHKPSQSTSSSTGNGSNNGHATTTTTTPVVNEQSSRFSTDPTTPQSATSKRHSSGAGSATWFSNLVKCRVQDRKVNEVHTTKTVERHVSPGESFLPDF